MDDELRPGFPVEADDGVTVAQVAFPGAGHHDLPATALHQLLDNVRAKKAGAAGHHHAPPGPEAQGHSVSSRQDLPVAGFTRADR